MIDVDACNIGSFLNVVPTSEAGLDWLTKNVGPGDQGRGQWPVYHVEHRFGPDLLLGAHNAGLTVSLDGRIADVERQT